MTSTKGLACASTRWRRAVPKRSPVPCTHCIFETEIHSEVKLGMPSCLTSLLLLRATCIAFVPERIQLTAARPTACMSHTARRQHAAANLRIVCLESYCCVLAEINRVRLSDARRT